VLFEESRDGYWVYRRNAAIQRSIKEIGLVTDDGIPYLRPEIQLLYKAGGSSCRKTDLDDLESVLPALTDEAREWLLISLHTEFPKGHDWIKILNRKNT